MTTAKPHAVDTPEGPRLPAENDPRHGAVSGYRAGCRCDDCRKAKAEHGATYRAANRQAIAKRRAAYRSDPVVRAAEAAVKRARYAADPVYRRAHSERNRLWRQEPTVREAVAANKRAWYASSPAALDSQRARRQDPAVREADAATHRIRYADDLAFRQGVVAAKRVWRQTLQGRAVARANSAARREWKGQGTATSADFAAVLAAADGSCAYCGHFVGEGFLDVDHVVPRALGGANDRDNLAAACRRCNRGPGGKLAEDPWTWIARTGASIPDVPALHRHPKPA